MDARRLVLGGLLVTLLGVAATAWAAPVPTVGDVTHKSAGKSLETSEKDFIVERALAGRPACLLPRLLRAVCCCTCPLLRTLPCAIQEPGLF